MLVTDQIKGWDFKRAFSADGSSTEASLRADKKRLEARLVEIPKLIAQLQHSIKVTQGDIDWVKSLGNWKKRKWEKEKNVVAEEWVRKTEAIVVQRKGQVSSLTTEKSRIPAQITAIQKQIDTLVKGESIGLEKGLDKESAKAIGELELEKERERLAHERAIREAELIAETKRQELQAEKDRQAMEIQTKEAEKAKAGKNQNKLFIGIGITLLLIIGGYILYKRKMAKAAA